LVAINKVELLLAANTHTSFFFQLLLVKSLVIKTAGFQMTSLFIQVRDNVEICNLLEAIKLLETIWKTESNYTFLNIIKWETINILESFNIALLRNHVVKI